MRIAVIGGTGRTGRAVVRRLVAGGHDVVALVRDPGRADLPTGVELLQGDVRDASTLRELVQGADAVISALGPRKGDATVHRDSAPLLVDAMRAAGVRRFVGVSGAGIAVRGDRKSTRDRIVSAILQRVGGDVVHDKAREYEVWNDSGLDWTLVRAPRITEKAPSGRVEHSASRSPRRTVITPDDLAAFVVHCALDGVHVGAAPLVAVAA